MKRKQAMAVLILISFCVLALLFLFDRFLKPSGEALEQYKTITLATPTTCDLPLIPLIEYLRDQSLRVTREITGDDKLAVSATVYATSEWKLKKRSMLTFNGLTIYDAFKKVAAEFDLSMKYEDGRFIFRDPEYADANDKNLFEEDKGR
jgi:hypothetical protein